MYDLCIYAFFETCETCSGETDGTGFVVNNDTNGNGVCDDEEVLGCADEAAVNYNFLATDDDGSCIYAGCTDENATNFCEYCTLDDGSCEFEEILGCTDESAVNYNFLATDDDGSCIYAGCTDESAINFCENCTLAGSTGGAAGDSRPDSLAVGKSELRACS